ncbi:MAG: citramalate synthase, partial [Bacteroidetes bacterium]|nr:citramalate synthase [Bacteroidota bacterium]
DYKVRILDGHNGTAAITRVLIDTQDGTRRWSTVGASPNIIEASWRALVDSVEYGLTVMHQNIGTGGAEQPPTAAPVMARL